MAGTLSMVWNTLALGSAKIWPVKLLYHQKTPSARGVPVASATGLMTTRIQVYGWFAHLKVMEKIAVALHAILSVFSKTRGLGALILRKLYILMVAFLVLYAERFLEYYGKYSIYCWGITIRVYSHSLVKEIAIKNELTLYFFFLFKYPLPCERRIGQKICNAIQKRIFIYLFFLLFIFIQNWIPRELISNYFHLLIAITSVLFQLSESHFFCCFLMLFFFSELYYDIWYPFLVIDVSLLFYWILFMTHHTHVVPHSFCLWHITWPIYDSLVEWLTLFGLMNYEINA
jgi:hypothetical protein